MQDTPDPSEETAVRVVQQVFNLTPTLVDRFNTGAQHFVYDVMLPDKTAVVVRLSRRSDLSVAQGAVYWTEYLQGLDLPLPKILASDFSCTQCSFPFVVLERLPGRDLGEVLDNMPATARQRLAIRLTDLQNRVTALPAGQGYGFVANLEDPFPHTSWRGVVNAEIERSRHRIEQAGYIDPSFADCALEACDKFDGYLSSVPPTPFLHDITTKNVIIHNNALSGIVDVDELCFGDPMYLPALINVALCAHMKDMSYVEGILDASGASAEDRAAVRLYSVVHCLGFLGELGTRFNRYAAEPVDSRYQDRLEVLFDDFLSVV